MPARLSPKQICSRIGLALFAMMLVWYATSVVAQNLVLSYAPQFAMQNPWIFLLLSSGPLFLLGMPVFLFIMRTIPNGPTILRWKHPFGAKQFLLAMVFCQGSSYILVLSYSLLALLFQAIFSGGGGLVPNTAQTLVMENSFLSNFVFVGILPAVGEEFIFRFMIRRKMRGCPDSTYILFSGLCFALFHGNLSQGVFTFVVGCMFAWAYSVTGKFLVPVSMHFVLNSIGILASLVNAENYTATILFGLLVLGLIAGAVIVFFSCRRQFLSTLQPPAEAGWPYYPRPPRPTRTPYADWYAAYARGAVAGGPPPAPMAPMYTGPMPIQGYGNFYGMPAGMPAPTQGFAGPYAGGYSAPLPQKTKRPAGQPHPIRLVFCNVGMLLFSGASLLLILSSLFLL